MVGGFYVAGVPGRAMALGRRSSGTPSTPSSARWPARSWPCCSWTGSPRRSWRPGRHGGGALAAGAHAARTGGGVLHWLDSAPPPQPAPGGPPGGRVRPGRWSPSCWTPPRGRRPQRCSSSRSRSAWRGPRCGAFAFAVRLVWGACWRTLGQPRWDDSGRLPGVGPGRPGGRRHGSRGRPAGSPAAGHRLPGAPRFATGWVVVRGDTPLFVYSTRRRGAGGWIWAALRATEVSESAFFRRVKLQGNGSANLYFGLDGPGVESLRAEFILS